MALDITITINDPATIALLRRYSEFIEQVDEVSGTLDQVAEGLVIGHIDENARFRQWLHSNCRTPSAR